MHDFLSDDKVMLASSLTILRDIRKTNKMENLILKMKVEVKEEEYRTCFIRLELFDSI